MIAGEIRGREYLCRTDQSGRFDASVPTLLEIGTEEQKRAYVGPTIRGDIIWCQGYSEPANGSDLREALQTKAGLQRMDSGVVNGQKNLDQIPPALRGHDVPAVPHRTGQAEA